MSAYRSQRQANACCQLHTARSRVLSGMCITLFWMASATLQAADFAHLQPLEEAEMEELRGGFQIAGLDMSFGATLQTLIDNVRMDTVFVINGAGAEVVSQTISQHLDIEGQVVTRVGQGSGNTIMELTPNGINLVGMKDVSGLVVNDSKGFTSAFHTVTRNAILGSVVSDASERDIHQRLDIGVQVNNLPALRAAQQRQAITESLAR